MDKLPLTAMRKSRDVFSYLGLLLVASCLYALVVIQPGFNEDFNVYTQAQGFPGILLDPRYGRGLGRIVGNAFAYGLVFDPIRFVQPGQWLVLVGFAFFIWNLTKKEPLALRFALVVLASIGFPYFGPAVIFKAAAPIHGLVSMIGVTSFAVLVRQSPETWRSRLGFAALFLLSIFGLETWLFFYAGVWLAWAVHLGLNAMRRHADVFDGVCSRFYFGFVGLGTGAGLYLRWITLAGSGPNSYHPVFHLDTWSYAFARTCLLILTVQVCVVPLALLAAYLARRGNLPHRESAWKHAAVGALAAIGGVTFFLLVTPSPEVVNFRTRFGFAVVEMIVFIYAPWDRLNDRLGGALDRYRGGLVSLAVLLFAQNIFFTFVHNGVRLRDWLDYRRRVLAHDTSVVGQYASFGERYSRYYIIVPSKYSFYTNIYWKEYPGLIPYLGKTHYSKYDFLPPPPSGHSRSNIVQ